VELGPRIVSAEGTVSYRKPGSYRIEIGGEDRSDCRIVGAGETAWVYFPDAETAVRVEFLQGDVASVLDDQSLKTWVDQAGEGLQARWLGTDTASHRKCDVIELLPPQQATENGLPVLAPAVGRRLGKVPFVGSWKRTRVYLDRKTHLPIRGDALKESGALVFTWRVRNLQVNPGLPESDFQFDPPKGVTVLQRKFDPEAPWTVFLPPVGHRSWLDRARDVLEGEGVP